jgi:hypothetical protein
MPNTFLDYYNDGLGADNTFRDRVVGAITVEALFRTGAGKTPDTATKNLCSRVLNDPEAMAAKVAVQVRSRLTTNDSLPHAGDVSDSTIQGQVSVVFDCWILAGA